MLSSPCGSLPRLWRLQRGGEEQREERGVAGREGRAYFHARPRGERRREGGHVAKNKLGSHACEGGHTGDALFLGAVWPLPFFRVLQVHGLHHHCQCRRPRRHALPFSCLAQLGFHEIKSCRASRCARSSSSFLSGGRLRLDDRPYACIHKAAFGAG